MEILVLIGVAIWFIGSLATDETSWSKHVAKMNAKRLEQLRLEQQRQEPVAQ